VEAVLQQDDQRGAAAERIEEIETLFAEGGFQHRQTTDYSGIFGRCVVSLSERRAEELKSF